MKQPFLSCMLLFLVLVVNGQSQNISDIDLSHFYNFTSGQYQVLAQSGSTTASQVNGFMNEMFCQYTKYFHNWTLKAGARIIVFSNVGDFRTYSAAATKMTHKRMTGYCHLKTDVDGNTFYELVTYEHERLWQVLAHEGFHQFFGYEVGLNSPMWLNEGMAQYFETSQINNGRLETGLVSEGRLRSAQRLILKKAAPRAQNLMRWDRTTYYSYADIAYPMSWSLVHYLLHANGGNYRNSTFRRYLGDLKWGRDSLASFQRRFGRDSNQWQREFEHYILNLSADVN